MPGGQYILKCIVCWFTVLLIVCVYVCVELECFGVCAVYIIIDRFYIALISALEQTHCARM